MNLPDKEKQGSLKRNEFVRPAHQSDMGKPKSKKSLSTKAKNNAQRRSLSSKMLLIGFLLTVLGSAINQSMGTENGAPGSSLIANLIGILGFLVFLFGSILWIWIFFKRRKNHEKITKVDIAKVISVSLLILIFVATVAVVFLTSFTSNVGQSSDRQTSSGYVVNRDNYITSCKKSVADVNTENQVSKETTTAYCGCIYDNGVEKFGGKKFTDLSYSQEDPTPEYNELINTCVATVQQ